MYVLIKKKFGHSLVINIVYLKKEHYFFLKQTPDFYWFHSITAIIFFSLKNFTIYNLIHFSTNKAMNSLFFNFFFSEFFSPSSIIQYTCTKNICTEIFYLSFKSKSYWYIYIFLTSNGPYKIKQNISFFHLKKKQTKTTKTSADQLTSQIQKTRNM